MTMTNYDTTDTLTTDTFVQTYRHINMCTYISLLDKIFFNSTSVVSVIRAERSQVIRAHLYDPKKERVYKEKRERVIKEYEFGCTLGSINFTRFTKHVALKPSKTT